MMEYLVLVFMSLLLCFVMSCFAYDRGYDAATQFWRKRYLDLSSTYEYKYETLKEASIKRYEDFKLEIEKLKNK